LTIIKKKGKREEIGRRKKMAGNKKGKDLDRNQSRAFSSSDNFHEVLGFNLTAKDRHHDEAVLNYTILEVNQKKKDGRRKM
jgi:hypothetical protein